jgi:cytochrome c oxidase assembly protein subunit 15
LRLWAFLAIFVVAGQIFLGGWTSTNYAALICPDFPMCQGAWLPETDFGEAFVLWRELGINYEFGVLEQDARTAIHFAHRLGAIATFLFVLGLVVFTLRSVQGQAKNIAWVVLLLLCLQVSLGISNIVFTLPLSIAVAHQGGAAFLLLSIVALNHALQPTKTP